jgi:uncharacterized protein (TIGR00375 family)
VTLPAFSLQDPLSPTEEKARDDEPRTSLIRGSTSTILRAKMVRIIADFQLHSKYSRATSETISLETLAQGACVKGLNLLGTGDFTHPLWLQELKHKLREIPGTGFYEFNGIYFILTGEICTVFEHGNKIRKVHHMVHAPSFEEVDQINERLAKFGDLRLDGRPLLYVTAAEVVEELMEVSRDIFVYPAHAWTPWFGIFGSKSGFDSVQECYEDQAKHIFAIETGLSSDPPMNWRLSELDRFALLSSSDAHSTHPWRLGREANVFELKRLDYWELHRAIREKDPAKFLYTIETNPNYGKYHYTGHRLCGVSLHPREALRLNNICPKCHRELTIGVLQRVEELADRPEGYVPENAIPFRTLLPLSEIISHVIGAESPYTKKVLEIYDRLLARFGNELKVLLEVPQQELERAVESKIARAVLSVREGRVRYVPGFDGEYGRPIFDDLLEFRESSPRTSVYEDSYEGLLRQSRLDQF